MNLINLDNFSYLPFMICFVVIFISYFGMLVILYGGLGSGKTLYLVVEANLLHLKGIKVYSNFNLKFLDGSKAETLNINLLIDLLNGKNFKGAIFLDEAYAWLESRTTQKQMNKTLSYILFQSRKRGIDFYLTVQLYETIDRRFRELCDHLIKAHYNFYEKAFNYDVKSYGSDGRIHKRYWTLPMYKAKKYFPNYDTKQIIRVDKIDELEYDLLKRDRKKYTQKVKELAEVIKPILEQYDKFSRDMVNLVLLEHDVCAKFTKDVYAKIKLMG